MANSSVVLTIETEKTATQAALDVQVGADKPRMGLKALQTFLNGIAGGQHRAKIDVQVGSVAPVAASGTWTLATVIATDEADLGGVAFTFTASPTLETDVLVTIGTAKAFASSTDLTYAGAVTETTHGYYTGDVGRLTTSSSLPGGFALSTDYFVIKIDADHYALASSFANAIAGTRILPSSLGVGNQTLTLSADKSTAARLAIAVNAHSTLSKIVVATVALAVVTVTCLVKGVVGNFIAFTDQDSTITSSGSGYLAGGLGGGNAAAQQYVLGL